MLNQNQLNRKKILDYFQDTWNLTELLFSGFKEKSGMLEIPYHNLRHPLIFYFCHPTVFYINKFQMAGLLNQGIHSHFERMFETGLDEMPWDIVPNPHKNWPDITELNQYREKAFEGTEKLISKHKAFGKNKITRKHPAHALFMSIEHERIHFETSSVLMRELPIHLLKKPKNWPRYWPLKESKAIPIQGIDFPDNKMIAVPKQKIIVGKKSNDPYYGWDNEYGLKQKSFSPFQASQYLISNGEFLQFVKNNGYEERRFWSDEGWQWKLKSKASYPTFWVRNHENSNTQANKQHEYHANKQHEYHANKQHEYHANNQTEYQLRTIFEIIPMQWDWPVIVNYHEAKAFTVWKSEKDKRAYRLPTEEEFHCLRDREDLLLNELISSQEINSFNKRTQGYNVNFIYGSEIPVNALEPNQKGFHDVYGNVWQWCLEPFSPLPGFKVHPYYIDFSTPCFDGLHQILMGSSFITTGAGASRFYRNYFRPHFFQHAGFRIVS